MSQNEPFVTYLELRESNAEGDAGAGLSHTSAGLVLLHVLELAAYGEPRGAVTIVHDAGEHGGRYLDLARELASRDWSVALPDLRGHGRSEGAHGHSNGIREVIRDIGDVQDHLAYRQPEVPKVLIGQGLGALYCLAYACERSDGVAALVLAAPLFEPRFQSPQSGGGFMKLFKKSGPTTPGRIGFAADALTSDPAEHSRRAADPLVHDEITLRAIEQASAAAAKYTPLLARLSMPILIVQGSSDTISPPAKSRAHADGPVEIKEFDGLRHDLFHETRARDVTSFVCDWLDRKLPR